jgi:hypothetical protein
MMRPGGGAPRHGRILSENSWRMTGIDDDRPCCAGIFGVGFGLFGETWEVTI